MPFSLLHENESPIPDLFRSVNNSRFFNEWKSEFSKFSSVQRANEHTPHIHSVHTHREEFQLDSSIILLLNSLMVGHVKGDDPMTIIIVNSNTHYT